MKLTIFSPTAPRAARGIRRPPDVRGRQGPPGRQGGHRRDQRQQPPGHPFDQDPRRGPRRRQEALAPEGHRPRPRRLQPLAPVGRRRRRLRPQAARLLKKINAKVKALAFSRALFDRATAGEIAVIEAFGPPRPRPRSSTRSSAASRRRARSCWSTRRSPPRRARRPQPRARLAPGGRQAQHPRSRAVQARSSSARQGARDHHRPRQRRKELMNADQILKTVLLTEKANKQSAELGQYTFEVFPGANKHAIAEAVEATFKVTVRRVNTRTTAARTSAAARASRARPPTTRRRS
jgi:large subunit ribosomal protein L23